MFESLKRSIKEWLGIYPVPAVNVQSTPPIPPSVDPYLEKAMSLENRDEPTPMTEELWQRVTARGHEMANELFEFGDAVVILVSVNSREGNNALTRLLKWSRGNVHAQKGMCELFAFERDVEGCQQLIRSIAAPPPPDLGNPPI